MIALSCAEVMRVNLRTITETDGVGIARAEILHEETSHIAVVDKLGRFVGLVSARELLGAAPDKLVREVMRVDVHIVIPATLAVHAVERMVRCHHSAVVVVDSDRHPIGMITSGEFFDLAYRALLELKPARRARRYSITLAG